MAPAETLEQLRDAAEEAVGLETPDHFFGIGQFYLDFAQTSDEEVEALLASPATAFPRTEPSTADPPTSAEVVVGPVHLPGILTGPAHPAGIVVFAHGSGSSRLSPGTSPSPRR